MIGVTSTFFYSISFSSSSIANWVYAVLGCFIGRVLKFFSKSVTLTVGIRARIL